MTYVCSNRKGWRLFKHIKEKQLTIFRMPSAGNYLYEFDSPRERAVIAAAITASS